MSAKFHEVAIKSGLKDRRKLSAFIDDIIKEYKEHVKEIRLNYIFCTDEYLLGINQQFLNHDTYTDIITFDLSEDKDEVNGEIYISVDRVKENATLHEATYQQELHRVIFHGALHLCGLKDKTKADANKMRVAENKCLNKFLN